VKVVVDTNVLISSIFFSGPPHSILEAWRKADVQFVMSPDIIEEYYRVSAELSDQFHRVEISSILTLLITHSEVVQSHALDRQVCQVRIPAKSATCFAPNRPGARANRPPLGRGAGLSEV
jgi:putative PIN family toxin of toxin-antitoxin system